MGILRHMLPPAHRAQLLDEISRVVALIDAERDAKGRSAKWRTMSSAANLSAWPKTRVNLASTIRPQRFTISLGTQDES